MQYWTKPNQRADIKIKKNRTGHFDLCKTQTTTYKQL